METEKSLSCSQGPATGPYSSQVNPVHTATSYFPEIYFNIILPFTPRSSKWSPPFRIPNQSFLRISMYFQANNSKWSQTFLHVYYSSSL